MAFENGNCELLSKIATSDQHGENSPYFDGWKAYDMDPFHPTQNRNGVIQMGLAENQLSFDLIGEWVIKNPTASICTGEGLSKFKEIAIFQDYHGLPKFREGVARFMGKARGDRVSFDPARIVMAGGATGAGELIMFCLADPGDAFLVPTPYYPAFDRDLKWRTRVQLIPVICRSSNGFKITKEALDEAYEGARRSNIRVKGVIVANPSNPLGTTLDRDAQKTLLRFINDKRIHLVCDEIYSSTVFAPPDFVSIAEIIEEEEEVKHCDRDLVHIIYSLSKDMGLPGFRVGIMYSYNDAVVICGRKMSSFGLVSSQTQHLLAEMLSDDEFVRRFLATNSERLAKRHRAFVDGLEEVGIKCLAGNAGLFCWMDLRPLLREATFDSEMELWRDVINQVKINVSPGFSFHCAEPGWFRVCFANMDDETLERALKRIRDFVREISSSEEKKHEVFAEIQEEVRMKNEKKKKKNLSVSLISSVGSSIRCEYEHESVMSPRSPLSPSQLVRART